jgi:hypothetical protein
MVLNDYLPPNSENLPIIAIFYISSIFIISIVSFFSVTTLNIHYKWLDGKPVPKCLQRLFFNIIGPIIFVNKTINN